MGRIALAVLALALAAVPAWPQTSSAPHGWYKAGRNPADYDVGVDQAVKRGGVASAFVRSRAPEPTGFGTLMQTIAADRFQGKRVRLAGYLKTEAVERSGVLWMRVDGRDRRSLAFDNMDDRGLRGTLDWTSVFIVLDVPAEAVEVSFGVMLSGAGQVWADDLTFEIVSAKTPTTGRGTRFPERPVNLDFERRQERKP